MNKAECLAIVKRESDAKTARDWMVDLGVILLRHADVKQDQTTALLQKVDVIAMCAQLPDDMVVRMRCFPNVWNLEA